MVSSKVSNLVGVTFNIMGTIVLSGDYDKYPLKNENDIMDFFWITDSTNLHFKGTGTVDGDGYMWWWREFF